MKILTIDIDYISAQSFELLHILQGLREIPDHTRNKHYWDRIIQESDVIERYLEPNLHNVRFINSVFYQAVRGGCKNIVFGYHHDSILNHISDDASNITLVNIDHHHDLAHNRAHEWEGLALGFYAEYNWVLKLEHRLDNYYWIKNENSGKFRLGQLPYHYVEATREDERIVKILDDIDDWDLIYVCLSPHNTPPKQWHYFWLMKETYEILTGQTVTFETEYYEKDQTHFDTENKLF
jgi:hypothetical protein